MAEYKLISADSHVSEPPDLWATRVDKKYRDRAPRLAVDLPGKEGAYFLYEGYAPHPIGIGLGAGKSPEELKEFLTKATYADARPGGWDPAERMKDNEVDGVEADVLYTTLGFRIFWLKDAGLQADCFRVYNDWLAEFCSYAPKHMAGLRADLALRPEGRRPRARALRQDGPEGRDDLVLAAAGAALQLRHLRPVLGGGAGAEDADQPARDHRHGHGKPVELGRALHAHHRARRYEVEKSFSVLIFSGVLDRFPNLQIVSAENNIGWIPYYLQRMDRAFERQRVAAGFTMKLKPSEYFQRQMWATYIDDYVGVASRRFIGVDRMMWSSDYPHQASSWPHSQEVVARDFKDASPEDGSRSPAATPPGSTGSSSRLRPPPREIAAGPRRCRTGAGTFPAPARRRSHSRARG